ncbi:unnamed protein product [Dibothriocephalus latus]|uniref:Protein kinase domain-containing protein n=1 Tax=Dibothriocephalus latus TaxID=60516 RepID=A0A3P7NTB7_DIBLA|nr:unnamed protein product [Dibothriocephalus latus]
MPSRILQRLSEKDADVTPKSTITVGQPRNPTYAIFLNRCRLLYEERSRSLSIPKLSPNLFSPLRPKSSLEETNPNSRTKLSFFLKMDVTSLGCSLIFQTELVLFCFLQPSQPVPVGLSHNLVDKWEISKSSIVLKERIGKGQFGEVYRAVWNGTTLVAVKTLRASKSKLADTPPHPSRPPMSTDCRLTAEFIWI